MKNIKKLAILALTTITTACYMSLDVLATDMSSVNFTADKEIVRIIDENNSKLSLFSSDFRKFIGNEARQKEVLWGYGIDSNNTISRASDICVLPDSSAGFNYSMDGINDRCYSNWVYKAVEDCTMKIFCTCTTNGTPLDLKIEFVAISGAPLASQTITATTWGNEFTRNIKKDSKYQLKVTNLSNDSSNIGIYVSGE